MQAPPPALFEVASSSGTSRVPAHGASLRIGRATDNDVVLSTEPTVSRHHAELVGDGDGWAVRDLGSHNGTYVNGDKLTVGEVREVEPGDVIGVGNVTLRLLAEAVDDGGMTVQDAGGGGALHRLLTTLSRRELEVLGLVAAGRTDDQIATELYISVKTVHSHLDRIRDKTGLRRRAELTRLAVRLGVAASHPASP